MRHFAHNDAALDTEFAIALTPKGLVHVEAIAFALSWSGVRIPLSSTKST
jgi:hypothetical protein